MISSARKTFFSFLFIYSACLFLLLSKLSLWLDEILDLQAVRHGGITSLLVHVRQNAGGVPLGYLLQAASLHVFSYSTSSARLPSALFSLIACAGLFFLGERVEVRPPVLAVVLFCLTPLQLRYALEARPYSQALALTVWATIVFFKVVDENRMCWAGAYSLLILASLYTQPYTIFVPAAHLLWLCFVAAQKSRRSVVLAAAGIVLALAGFVPWYLYAQAGWSSALTAHANAQAGLGISAVRMVAREVTGAGYAGTALMCIAAGLGLRYGKWNQQERWFWILYTTLPIAFAVLADGALGYFLAIRQMLWILAPLAILGAAGLEWVATRRAMVSGLICSLLIAVLIVGDIRFFLKPRENWKAAADVLERLTRNGGCIVFVPAESSSLYSFFSPELAGRRCTTDVVQLRSALVAESPYDNADVIDIVANLLADGFVHAGQFNRQGPRVDWYEREGNLATRPRYELLSVVTMVPSHDADGRVRDRGDTAASLSDADGRPHCRDHGRLGSRHQERDAE